MCKIVTENLHILVNNFVRIKLQFVDHMSVAYRLSVSNFNSICPIRTKLSHFSLHFSCKYMGRDELVYCPANKNQVQI